MTNVVMMFVISAGHSRSPDLCRPYPVIISACVFCTFGSLPHFQCAFFLLHHHSVTETNYLALLTLREAGESRQIASHPGLP